jgi:hypothetical protein
MSSAEVNKTFNAMMTKNPAFSTVVGVTRTVDTDSRANTVSAVCTGFKRPFFKEFRKFLEHEDYLDGTNSHLSYA